ncbi:spore germination protein GerPC [Alteribacillus bidgolensis]|uniref:Spore germination protein PC n=1 Tax=Alteribacillus bidgolensis TaxID=930129 RepID=A0A1G8CVZ8_9BACI|nr:spore germination protein GerPC [Alteribacillus bidgolensis]SDH49668.1 spore germination protein PC [Alteribacillus bidgolensis]
MYDGYWEMVQNIQALYRQLQFQQNQISQMESMIEQLQEEINKLKQNHSSNIEKIEYKFDQLKVETLEGTLNIGITPNANDEDSNIEDFVVGDNKVNTQLNEQKHNTLKNIEKHIHDYLNDEGYTILESFEKKYSYYLDVTYRQFIIEDIKKQINKRIQHYLHEYNISDPSHKELAKIEEMTIIKVKKDIYNTCEEFIRNLPRKEY